MLLNKRRSRSECRNVELKENNTDKKEMELLENDVSRIARTRCSQALEKRSHLERMETVPGMSRRKTSAELISEAKIYLGSMNLSNINLSSNTMTSGGLRLLNTRRPITPREPGRALYGSKVSIAGRPPSAFSLKYLRNEVPRTPKTPSLEPIKGQNSLDLDTITHENLSICRQPNKMTRSNSLDNVQPAGHMRHINTIPKKLPALEVKGYAMEKKMDTKTMTKDFNAIERGLQKKFVGNDSIENDKSFNQSNIEKLIELLKEHAGLKDCSEDTVEHISSILTEIYGHVSSNKKHIKRGFILSGLYGLVECTSPKVLLAVARVVLALHVTGSNLTGACKLIFKVARNEQNDALFHDNDLLELLIDGLGNASPIDDPEACIYGYGSIRFLTSSNSQERTTELGADQNRNCVEDLQQLPATSPDRYTKFSKQCTLVERLARHGAVELMILHLQILNEAGAIKKLIGPPLHSLYQLSAALRALADVNQVSNSLEKDFDGADDSEKVEVVSSIQLKLACPHLIRAAEISIGELEVQANIVRTLSILSEDESCCKVLSNFTPRIGLLLGPCLELFNGSSEKLLSLFSRLGYILGNIMAKSDEARKQFYHNDVAMEYLLKVMTLYGKEPLTLHNAMGDTVIDVLIKMIRVIANMSVNIEVGFGLGNTYALGGLLLRLLNAIHEIQPTQQKNEIRELILATLGSLHNLCFYQDKNSMPSQVIESEGSLQTVLLDVTAALCNILRSCNDTIIVVEASRVLGNITRNEKARKYFCKIGGLPLIIYYIDQKNKANNFLDYDLKACTAGILVNLLGDAENRKPFLDLNGFVLLANLLKLALVKNHDWFLATVVCQALWNLLIDAPRMTDICNEGLLDEICDLLSDYLDEQIFDDINIEEPDALWDGFAMVATDLLERIQNNFEQENQEQIMRFAHDNQNNEDDDDVFIEEM